MSRAWFWRTRTSSLSTADFRETADQDLGLPPTSCASPAACWLSTGTYCKTRPRKPNLKVVGRCSARSFRAKYRDVGTYCLGLTSGEYVHSASLLGRQGGSVCVNGAHQAAQGTSPI